MLMRAVYFTIFLVAIVVVVDVVAIWTYLRARP